MIRSTRWSFLEDPLLHRLPLLLSRRLFEELRVHKPILVLGRFALVTRHADVHEVLASSDAFGVTEIYADKMAGTTGEFILGMEETAQYQRELAWLKGAVHRGDADDVRALARAYVQEAVEDAKARCSGDTVLLDAVGAVSRRVPIRLVHDYFGVPVRDEAEMKRWMRTIFWHIFVNLTNAKSVTQAAAKSARELDAYLDALIVERRDGLAERTARDDFLSRLLASGVSGRPAAFTPMDVRRNIGGIILGAVDTLSKAIAQALAELLRRPDELAGAMRAARANDVELVGKYAFEALRFDPHNPILLRRSHREHVIAQGTRRETTIRAGTTVCVATLSAMFDPDRFPDPEQFRTDRPDDSYLHFGDGQHRCFGERLNRAIIPEVLGALLRLPNLRRARGETMTYEGPFPDRFIVEFDK